MEMCALCRPHFLTDFFKFFTDVHHSQIYTPIVFGDAALSVPSFIGYFGGNLACALQATFLDGFFSNFVQMCIIVKSTHL